MYLESTLLDGFHYTLSHFPVTLRNCDRPGFQVVTYLLQHTNISSNLPLDRFLHFSDAFPLFLRPEGQMPDDMYK